MCLSSKTVFITGGSRGIGRAIALKLAAHGANIVIAAKSVTEDPRLGGTIYSVAQEIEQLGAKALALPCDIRNEQKVQHAVEQALATFGSIDVLINNASAIYLSNTEQLTVKQFDLMHDINLRGTFMVAKYCLPHLKAAAGHIVTLSPPLNMDARWLKTHAAYTIAKYGMTMLTMGWAEELRAYGVRANTLWPRTTIDTAAVRNLLGGEALANRSRSTAIMADAVYTMLTEQEQKYNGQMLIDEDVLRMAGVADFDRYAVMPGSDLQTDLFL